MAIFDDDSFDILPFVLPSLFPITSSSFPLNVSSTLTHYVIRTGLSGISQNQISIDISKDGLLTIQAERQSLEDLGGKTDENIIIKENYTITKDKLQRSVKFNKDSIDINGIKAGLNDGELIIKVPKKMTREKEKKFIKIVRGKL